MQISVRRGVRRRWGFACVSTHNLEKSLIFILYVGTLVFHLSLYQQVPQIPFLQKPLEKLAESSLHRNFSLILRLQEPWNVTGTCHCLDFAQVVRLASKNVRSIFLAQLFHFLIEGIVDKLPDDFLGDISTDVFPVVSLAFPLLYSFVFVENIESLPDGLISGSWIPEIENEVAGVRLRNSSEHASKQTIIGLCSLDESSEETIVGTDAVEHPWKSKVLIIEEDILIGSKVVHNFYRMTLQVDLKREILIISDKILLHFQIL